VICEMADGRRFSLLTTATRGADEPSFKRRPEAQAARRPVDRSELLAREHRRQPAVGDFENAYDRHRRFVAEYASRYASRSADPAAHGGAPLGASEYAIAREHSRFIWRASAAPLVWEERVAKNYYERLFKEYAIADLAQYEHGRIGLRWRTEAEVVDGKGQFVCASRGCSETAGLCSYEINFRYAERGETHNALVKLRCCGPCALKLNHRTAHKRAAPPPQHAASDDAPRKRRKELGAQPPAEEGRDACEEQRASTPKTVCAGREPTARGVWSGAVAEGRNGQPGQGGSRLPTPSSQHAQPGQHRGEGGDGSASFERFLQTMLL